MRGGLAVPMGGALLSGLDGMGEGGSAGQVIESILVIKAKGRGLGGGRG